MRAERARAGILLRRAVLRPLLPEDLNFLLTNRIPRRLATLLAARLSRLEVEWLTPLVIGVWQFFADDLHVEEARARRFRRLHECFIRELREGVRPIDPDPRVVVSPCDGVVGAFLSGHASGIPMARAYPTLSSVSSIVISSVASRPTASHGQNARAAKTSSHRL